MSVEKIYPEGLLGKKLGMTQMFAENGVCVPVTVIQLGPCYITDIRDRDTHGYSAVQLGFEPKKPQRVNKPETGHFGRSGKGSFYHVKEIRCSCAKSLGWTDLGKELRVEDVFTDGELVDVTGFSIGRGFAGVVKRYGVRGQPATRGTHEHRRNIGSIGNCKSPGRVFKNRKMPGHMGNARVTIQNLKVMRVKGEDNLLLVKGCVPGYKGALVTVRKAVKGYVPSSNGAVNKNNEKAA
jgi:large subunit ribosomal protein L3